MEQNLRHKRLRQLVGKLNKQRKIQTKKIDILCNDFVDAHRAFIRALGVISSTADFYQSIIGVTDLNRLLFITSDFIKSQIPYATVGFFLRREESFDLHLGQSDKPIEMEQQRLENCFTTELVNSVCTANKICELDELLTMGLEANPNQLSKISAFTIPLGQFGTSLGFTLVYRESSKKLTGPDLEKISAITTGFSQAIQSCVAEAGKTR